MWLKQVKGMRLVIFCMIIITCVKRYMLVIRSFSFDEQCFGIRQVTGKVEQMREARRGAEGP